MHKISPCCWLDNQAMEAANFYTSIFDDSEVLYVSHYLKNAPVEEGTVLVAQVRISNIELNLLNGGPVFQLNPSISLIIECESEEQIDYLWNKLSDGGSALMQLQEYDFAGKYGWLADKYGINWQLMLTDTKFNIYPALLFVNEQFSKGREAIDYYQGIFETNKKPLISYYDENDYSKGMGYSNFMLDNTKFCIADSDYEHQYDFNEAFSFIVECKDQKDIDNIYDQLLEGGIEQECGWLKDKFGVSWQIVYDKIDQMVIDDNKEKAQRVMDALLSMKRINVKEIDEAFK